MYGFDDMSGVINQQSSLSQMLGMNPGQARLSGYEGQSLPASTYAGGDHAAVPWSLDSPLMWGLAIAAATVLGFIGASADVRLGRRHARASVGD